jgi:hypothetical protein
MSKIRGERETNGSATISETISMFTEFSLEIYLRFANPEPPAD